MQKPNTEQGFSLIELMIAMAISGVVLTGVYASYHDQLRTSLTQERIVDMNQNLRSAMVSIERDLRMAGANPTGDADAGIATATASVLALSMDDDGSDVNWADGDTTDEGEVIRFDLDNGNLRRRFNAAGATDPTLVPANTDHLSRNIDALNFVYLDGADPPNVLASPVTGSALEDISSVQVTIVARDGSTLAPMARTHTDNNIYTNQQGDVLLDLSGAPDRFRRRMVTTTIKCRNLGL
jgi:type IV pilus assembly protein PilW